MQHPQVWCSIAALACFISVALAFQGPHAYPYIYPNQPQTGYGPEWQDYFRVPYPLPNITFPLSTSYAGNLPVDREGHPNNTLWFWGFEKSPGSLTAPLDPLNNEPWGIWLSGPGVDNPAGAGISGLQGLLLENGPIRINSDFSASPNPYSWSNLADYFWLDQPAGVAFATSDYEGLPQSGEEIGEDFMRFLANLVKVFPSLATRPLYLTGEGMAGYYIPYMLKAYFGMANPPVKIAKVAIGSGSYTAEHVFELLPALSVIETFPQLIGYDTEVYEYFKAQTKLCGYDVNLTYPQDGKIHIKAPERALLNFGYYFQKSLPFVFGKNTKRAYPEEESVDLVERTFDKDAWKRTRSKDALEPRYGCFLYDMLRLYTYNYTAPWNTGSTVEPSASNVQDTTKNRFLHNTTVFINDPVTRSALHTALHYPFRWFSFSETFLPEADGAAINIFDDLAINMTAHDVKIVLFSGNKDMLIPHLGTEIAIQNTTFGGIQGFTRRPSTPWTDDAGEFAGIVHQERGWTYALFTGAGQHVPRHAPRAAYTFFKEFILGNNQTGSVVTVKGQTVVIGGEDPSLAGIIRGGPEVYHRDRLDVNGTQTAYIAPSATRAAWDAYMASATATSPPQRREVASNFPWALESSAGASDSLTFLMISGAITAFTTLSLLL
ncbi:hypothetical protein CVT24_006275 [Panaeolus cyanescens]|uniref:Carboxypeptidase n=1 Tax=Panaeolus cyanescens TaxID=181874 RepID=A0A409VE33_9AGAR|nr:hypothetical protein CVT24_006275 [Panaeolus cyanescens]